MSFSRGSPRKSVPCILLVNAAGINIKNRMMAEMEPEQWDRVMAINATGAYNCIHAVLPQMRTRHDGVIVNISSTSGKRACEAGRRRLLRFEIRHDGAFHCCCQRRSHQRNPRNGDLPRRSRHANSRQIGPHRYPRRASGRMLQPEDIAAAVLLVATLPPRAHVLEMIIKPTTQEFV